MTEQSHSDDLDFDNETKSPRETARARFEAGHVAEDRHFVKALARGLIILETFANSGKVWMQVSEIAEAVDLPKPTVARFVRSLESLGHLHYSSNRREYRLDAPVLTLGFAARQPFTLGEILRPHLQKLADTYNVHASLAKRDRLDALEVVVCHSKSTLMTLKLDVGSRLPLAGTATGTALLAHLPEKERDVIYHRLRERHGRNWERLLQRINDGFNEIEDRGFVTAYRSWATDINGVSVPIRSLNGAPTYALACGAPAALLPPEKQHLLGYKLLEIKRGIERLIQHNDQSMKDPDHDRSQSAVRDPRPGDRPPDLE
ncbi:IclR family transcriptional regulator [Sulfitobacter sp. 1A15333]|uniref:IclR family transcriptional regulator n=1 Tax=unclassified Sulfitobacter TaxID=196795 RepID=UPI003746D69A